jgi:hypothetical protein
MILPKTSITDVDLDEFERQLREFESSRLKSSTAGVSEHPQVEAAQVSGGKNPKGGRQNRRAPTPASSVQARQKPMKSSAKANVDDVERRLREVASSVLRKSRPSSEKGDLLVSRDKQPEQIPRFNADEKAASADAAGRLGLIQETSWRPIILQTYSERSVVSRCARSLALPLLLLALGAGTLVMLDPEGALTNIGRSAEDARATRVERDDQKPPLESAATAASFDQPSRSATLAEPSANAAPAVVAPGGAASPTQVLASPGNLTMAGPVSPNETSDVKVHDAAEVMPIRVAADDRGPSSSALDPAGSAPAPTGQSLDAAEAPAAAPSIQAKLVETSGSPNPVIVPHSDVLPGEALSQTPRPDAQGSATPQAQMPLPTITPSPTPDAVASSAIGIKPDDSNSGSRGDAISDSPQPVLAALAPVDVLMSRSVVARSPMPDEAAAPSLAAGSNEAKSGSPGEPVPEAPAQVEASEPSSMPSVILPPAIADVAASAEAEIIASIVSLRETSSPTPAETAPPLGASDRVASRRDSIDETVPASAMAALSTLQTPTPVAASPAPDGPASSQAQTVVSEKPIHSKPFSAGEALVDVATASASQEAPTLPPPVALMPEEILAQATPVAPIRRGKPSSAELVVAQGSSGAIGAALPLRVSLNGAPAGAIIVIKGLPAGATLSVGRPLETGGWQLAGGELPDAALRPPQGFAGVMELELELRLPNDGVADRKTLHLEWTAIAGSQATRPDFVIRHLEPDEVAALLKRGEGFIASGDLASARLVLQRAAEAGEAQAALSLAGTFDPIVLDRLGLQGQKADIEKARIWYQRAQELGSAAAPRRLRLLADYDQ